MGVTPLPSVANNVAVCYTETDTYEFRRERYCNELSILRSRNDTGQGVQQCGIMVAERTKSLPSE